MPIIFKPEDCPALLAASLGQSVSTSKGSLVRIKRPRNDDELAYQIDRYGNQVFWIEGLKDSDDLEIIEAHIEAITLFD